MENTLECFGGRQPTPIDYDDVRDPDDIMDTLGIPNSRDYDRDRGYDRDSYRNYTYTP